MLIKRLNKLFLDVVANDFSGGAARTPDNPGPTATSRALAIVHLAARDAYAMVTGAYAPKLAGLPAVPAGIPQTDDAGQAAAIGAGLKALNDLYSKSAVYIADRTPDLTGGLDAATVAYGGQIGDAWVASRNNDGSEKGQIDPDSSVYSGNPGRYRPDPVSQKLGLGRSWGTVRPFILADPATDAPLEPPPALPSKEYADAYDDVFVNGRDDISRRDPRSRHHAALGIFWGYDGSNQLGTPPRLYNQILVATDEFDSLCAKDQLNVLAAVNAAMADAGIAAWHWKYVYDLWRPVTAIREAEAGWGPSARGDGNAYREQPGDPFWKPLGAPKSNPPVPPVPGAPGDNFTPNFPAYPSGHASFGTACFETFAALVGETTSDVVVRFASDEFNGITTDNTGAVRPRWEQTLSLAEAIEQNKVSRIYLGVHWIFDATGGEKVGQAVAQKAIAAFR